MMEPAENAISLLQQALAEEQQRNETLAANNKALVEEFSKAGTYEEQLEIAKNAIKDILPEAIRTMNSLITDTSAPEGVRASLSKYVLDTVISGKLDKSADASVADLLRKLAENGDNVPARVVAGNDSNNN